MEYIKECMYPVVLVWDLILDQPLPQSSREAAHVLRRPALVRHAQGRSPGLLQVSWPRPPVLWRARTFSTLSSGLDAHVSLMNLSSRHRRSNTRCSSVPGLDVPFCPVTADKRPSVVAVGRPVPGVTRGLALGPGWLSWYGQVWFITIQLLIRVAWLWTGRPVSLTPFRVRSWWSVSGHTFVTIFHGSRAFHGFTGIRVNFSIHLRLPGLLDLHSLVLGLWRGHVVFAIWDVHPLQFGTGRPARVGPAVPSVLE